MVGAVIGGFTGASSVSTNWPAAFRVTYVLTSACLGAFTSATNGCRSGVLLGRLLDETVIARWVCQDCGHRFSGTAQNLPDQQRVHPDYAP